MTFSVVEGGSGTPPEPDWSLLFNDEIDQAIAREQWAALISELSAGDKLAFVNGHQIKRLVVSYVLFEQAARHVAEEGAVTLSNRTKSPQYNPWFTVLKDANTMAMSAESELTVTPRRRNNGGKVKRQQKKASAAEGYLKPVKR